MAIGLLLVTGGMLLMATTSPTSIWVQLLPGFVLIGVGIGLVNPVLAAASVAVVPVERSGMASGSNFTFRQLGIATGIAGYGAIFADRIQSHTSAALRSTATGQLVLHHGGAALGAALQSGGVREAAAAIPSAPARAALLDAYRIGFSQTFKPPLKRSVQKRIVKKPNASNRSLIFGNEAGVAASRSAFAGSAIDPCQCANAFFQIVINH